ncbi:membrane-spanning 4-domains subfamily A member 4A [Cricetulus griseus]
MFPVWVGRSSDSTSWQRAMVKKTVNFAVAISAAMITIQGIEQTALEAGYDAQQLGQQPLYVNSQSWKRMVQKFLKGEPKILGVVQIVIALMNLAIGIMMISTTVPYNDALPISVYIGYPIWGSLMVRSSLGLNITSSVFAFSGIIISSLSPSIHSFHYYYCTYRSSSESCNMTVLILMIWLRHQRSSIRKGLIILEVSSRDNYAIKSSQERNSISYITLRSTASAAMTPMKGIEQTTTEVAPGGAQTSERFILRPQMWKENAEKFLKGEPKVLGVVQVMIALIYFSLGMIVNNTKDIHILHSPLSMHIWAPVWGSIVVAGSLSLNIISSVVAAATSIISAISVTVSVAERLGKIVVNQEEAHTPIPVLSFLCVFHIEIAGFSVANSNQLVTNSTTRFKAIQIMCGVMVLCLGIILASTPNTIHFTPVFSLLLKSGYPFVGSLFGILSLMLISSVLELGLSVLTAMLWWNQSHSDFSRLGPANSGQRTPDICRKINRMF